MYAVFTRFLFCQLTFDKYPACVIPFGQVNELDATEPFQVGDDQIAPECKCRAIDSDLTTNIFR